MRRLFGNHRGQDMKGTTFQTRSATVRLSQRTVHMVEWNHHEVERVLKELSEGSILYKVKSSTRHLERCFHLDMENMVMYYTGSKKKNRDTAVRISKIREVREGEKDYSKKLKDLDLSYCFVVVLGASHNIMYLRATKPEIRDKWIRGLRYAMQMEQLAQQKNETDRWVREAFNMADKNADGQLDLDEVMKLLKTLNADIKRKYVKDMFDAADTNKNVGKGRSGLDREEFVTFYNALTKRVELEEIFLKFSRGKGHMTTTDLIAFMKDGQKRTDVTEQHCQSVIDECEPDGTCRNKDQLTMIGFRNFLLSERQLIFKPDHRVVYQDMSKPMTHYFIASSHNTYLAEDQLKGPSQVEMYISALKKGCRCVELDCWDGSDNEPVIYHGYTLTSKILFKDVINAINDYAFEASPYPVVLSLENHCSIEQQEVMAHHMTSILGDKLWVPQTDIIATPSPEELRNKILIKGKRLPKSMLEDEDVSDEDEAADIPQDQDNDQSDHKKTSGSHKKIKLNARLSEITTMQSVAHKSVESAPDANKFFSVISLGESKVEKMIENKSNHVNAITHHTLIRTYPAGTRTDSSNYNPVPEWNAGCQIVALNYQTSGECMQLNHGKFLDNGKCGYLLKPYFLMSDAFSMVSNGITARSISKRLKITIISGYQIPKPNDSTKGEIIDPFVKIEIHGAQSDNAEFKTKVIENNGFNPRWYETCVFNIRVPELAVVRFTVVDQDRGLDDFIGYYSLPMMSIQEGFRHFPLFDKYGSQFSQSVIFTHIAISPMSS